MMSKTWAKVIQKAAVRPSDPPVPSIIQEQVENTGETTSAGDAVAAAVPPPPPPEAPGAENPKAVADSIPKAPEEPAKAPLKPATAAAEGKEVKAEVGGAEGPQGLLKGPVEGEEGAAPFNTVLDFLSSLLTKNYKEALRLSKNILKYEPKNKTVAEFLNVLEDVVAGGLLEDSECSSSGSEEDSSDGSSGSESSESEDSSSSEDTSDEEEEQSLAVLEAETRHKHCGPAPDLDLESVLTTTSTVCKCRCRRHRHEEPAGRHSKKHYGHATTSDTTTTRVHKNSHHRHSHHMHHSHNQEHHQQYQQHQQHHQQHDHHVHEHGEHRLPRHSHFERADSPGASVMSEATGVSGATGVFTADGCGESVMADSEEFLKSHIRERSGCPPQNHHCCCVHNHHQHHHNQQQQHHRRHHCSKAALLRSMESRLNTPQVRNCLLRTAPDEQEAAMMRRALWAVAEAATFDSCGGGDNNFAPPAFDASMLGLPGSRLCSPEPSEEVLYQMDRSFGMMMPEDLQSMGSCRLGSNNGEASSSSSAGSGQSPGGFRDTFEADGRESGSETYGQEMSFGGGGSFGPSFSMSTTFDEEDDEEEEEDDDDDGDTYNVGVLGAMPAPPLKSILKGSSGCPRHRFFRDEVRFDESALMARGVGSSSSSCSTGSSNTTDDGYSS